MRSTLRYLKYVVMHKLYVFAGGVAINGYSPRWVWRLLIHDLSKLRPSEWRPYAEMFYGTPGAEWIARKKRALMSADALLTEEQAGLQAGELWNHERVRRQRRFDYAWLLHQHRNPHHWQHWILREDSGATKLLLQEAVVVDEMVADWLGAGTKIFSWPSLAECVAKTVQWYVENRGRIQLREPARQRVEMVLTGLCRDFGLTNAALDIMALAAARSSITIAAPEHGGLARVISER